MMYYLLYCTRYQYIIVGYLLFYILLSVAVGKYLFNFFKMIFFDWFIIDNFWIFTLLPNDTSLIGLQIR